jgi:hypothetical protein
MKWNGIGGVRYLCSRLVPVLVAGALSATWGCGSGGGGTPAAPSPAPAVNPNLTPPVLDSPSDRQQLDTLRPTLTVRNGTSDQPGTRTYEFQISDASDFSGSTTSQIPSFFNVVTTTDVTEGADGKTSFTPTVDLQPTTRFYWRARLVQGTSRSEWSATGRFNSRLVGFIRAGELYDPLIHGETVGTRVGTVQFITGKGARLVTHSSHIRYRLPATVRAGEFSMIVEGLRANAHGDKTKVFGMQEGLTDFITNMYRVDAQYRGAPSNVINWRAIFGSEEDQLDPTRAEREASVLLAKPDVAYLWRGTWGSGFRLEVLEGGMNGRVVYNRAKTIDADYGANPHYAFLGAPVGRSGPESASVEGATYRNVWLGSRPRPASLGSALEN